MRGILLFVMLFLSPALAMAGKNDAEWNPPSRFDHAFAGKLRVRYLPQKQIVAACQKLFAKYNVPANLYPNQKGCSALTSEASCTVIVVNKTYETATPKAVIRHETGHCNGWGADHPN